MSGKGLQNQKRKSLVSFADKETLSTCDLSGLQTRFSGTSETSEEDSTSVEFASEDCADGIAVSEGSSSGAMTDWWQI